MTAPSVWQKHALQWQRLGPPLRPSAEDLLALRQVVAQWVERKEGRHLLAALLGVTLEVAHSPWPSGTRLVAVDQSDAMIRAVWPGREVAHCFAVCADWRRLPLKDGACDIVVGDGCFNVLAYPDGYGALLEALCRALGADGRLVVRFFIRPDRAEPAEAVLADLEGGRIAGFHAFKLRLAMALHGNLAEGVCVGDVWRTWNGAIASPDRLADRLGWPREIVATIDAYRDSPTRYTFPTMAEARAALAPRFRETACRVPRYELGERCPTFVLAPI